MTKATPIITASLLYDHLACPHRVAMDAIGDPARRDSVGPLRQLLWEQGTRFERETLRGLGQPFTDLSGHSGEEKEQATREAIARGDELIYGGRLSVHEMLGEPDLLRRENGRYAAIDIKSGSGLEGSDEEQEGRPKKHYGVQLALYTHILELMDLSAGRYGYIRDVRGREVRYELDAMPGPRSQSLWDAYLEARGKVVQTLQHPEESRPALCRTCRDCVWRSQCLGVLEDSRDLSLVPELGRAARDALREEFPALPDLAVADPGAYSSGGRTPFRGVGEVLLRRFQRRAALQVDNGAPYLTEPISWPEREVELYFDIEADPMRDLVYLHGFLIREISKPGGAASDGRFRGLFAEAATPEAEREVFAEAMALLRHFPQALVIHYSSYERTQYRRLAQRHPQVASVDEIEQLFAPKRALDLLALVLRQSVWPTHDHSIKTLARYCGFNWRDADPSGASSIEWFDQWAGTGDTALRERLLAYNEDDCRAMRVVADAMRGFEVKVF